METYFPIRGLKNAPDRVAVRKLVPPFQAQHSRVRTVDQLPHAGKTEFFACSPISELHARFVRYTHIVVNAAVAVGVHV